jgi:putative sigma-54 modulation protein
MRLDLTGRNVEITPPLRQLLARKMSRLDRVMRDAALSAQIVLTRERYRHVTDITLHARGDNVLAGAATASTWEESVSTAVEKVTQQAQRVKEKWTTRKRRATSSRVIELPPPVEPQAPAPGPQVPAVGRQRYPIRRHTLTAAATRLSKVTEPFVLYRDGDTLRLQLLYRRKDGSLALIEPEA